MLTDPELPTAVVPLLSSKEPDVPLTSAFAESRVTDPEPLLVLPPDTIDTDPPTWLTAAALPASINTAPPVDISDVPADRTTAPPALLVPVPTSKLIAPPLPLDADPE